MARLISCAVLLPTVLIASACFKPGSDDVGTDDTGDSSGTTGEPSESGESGDPMTETDTGEDGPTTDDTTDDTGPMCGDGETECDGACVVLDSDPLHCGACGHDCLGGGCANGSCEAVELASGKGRLFMVLVDDQYIYYGGDGVDVGRVNKDGTGDMVLVPKGPDAQSSEFCYDSAITPDAVVWGNDWVQGGVRGCLTPSCAGGVTQFVAGDNLYAMNFNDANDKLYWNQAGDIVERVWPGGQVSTFVTNQGTVFDIDADAFFVYWSARVAADDFHLRKLDVGGNQGVVDLVVDRTTVGDVELGPDNIYWPEDTTIYMAALPNGGQPASFGTPSGSVRKMTVDGDYLYWTARNGELGFVERCPLDGCDGPPEVLAQSPQPWGITVDDVAVYWVTEQGLVAKVAK